MSDQPPKRPWQNVTINFPSRKFGKYEPGTLEEERQRKSKHELVPDESMTPIDRRPVYPRISKHLAKEIRDFKQPLRKVKMSEQTEEKMDTSAPVWNRAWTYKGSSNTSKKHNYKMPKRYKRSSGYSRRGGLDRDTIERRRIAMDASKLASQQLFGKLDQAVLNEQGFVRGSPANLRAFGASASTCSADQMANRSLYKYKGRGDYRRWIPRIAGAAWHGLQGGFAGFGRGGIPGAISGAIDAGHAGWDAGANLSKLIGWGDYGPMSTNKIVDGGSGPQQNISVNDDSMTGDIYFSHTEYIGNLTVTTPSAPASGTTSFQLLQYDLNPGLKNFPFLAQIAANFELYQWQGLIFQYKPLSGEFGASSVSNTLGKIVMATKYGVNQNTAFNSMIEMQNYDYANSTKPSCAIVHGVETDPKQGLAENLMVRTGAPDPSAPRVLYDLGKFYIATEGIPYSGASQTIVLGELWVSYRVKLSRAKLWDSLGEAIAYDKFTGTSSATQLVTGFTRDATSTIGGTMQILILQSAGIYIFPASINQGKYMLVFRSTSTAANTGNFTAPTVPSAYQATTTISGFIVAPDNGAGSTANFQTVAIAFVTVNAPNQTQAGIQFNRSANAAGTFDLYITQIDPQLS